MGADAQAARRDAEPERPTRGTRRRRAEPADHPGAPQDLDGHAAGTAQAIAHAERPVGPAAEHRRFELERRDRAAGATTVERGQADEAAMAALQRDTGDVGPAVGATDAQPRDVDPVAQPSAPGPAEAAGPTREPRDALGEHPAPDRALEELDGHREARAPGEREGQGAARSTRRSRRAEARTCAAAAAGLTAAGRPRSAGGAGGAGAAGGLTRDRQAVGAPTFLLLPMLSQGQPIGLIYADMAQAGSLVLAASDLSLLRALRDHAVAEISRQSEQ